MTWGLSREHGPAPGEVTAQGQVLSEGSRALFGVTIPLESLVVLQTEIWVGGVSSDHQNVLCSPRVPPDMCLTPQILQFGDVPVAALLEEQRGSSL